MLRLFVIVFTLNFSYLSFAGKIENWQSKIDSAKTLCSNAFRFCRELSCENNEGTGTDQKTGILALQTFSDIEDRIRKLQWVIDQITYDDFRVNRTAEEARAEAEKVKEELIQLSSSERVMAKELETQFPDSLLRLGGIVPDSPERKALERKLTKIREEIVVMQDQYIGQLEKAIYHERLDRLVKEATSVQSDLRLVKDWWQELSNRSSGN